MIELTPAAARQIELAARHHGEDRDHDDAAPENELALRVAAWPAPDGSVEYGMGFDEEREGDLALCVEGVDLLIGAPSRVFLVGTVLDYVEYEPGDFRFIFIPSDAQDAPAPHSSCAGGGCSGCSGTR